jgi:hypothetical protein
VSKTESRKLEYPLSPNNFLRFSKNTIKILEMVMTKSISLDALWNSATPTELVFSPDKLSHLPEPAKRYLEHAIAPGTKLAAAVRLKMHGEIKLKKWIPFKAEQVICWEHGLIWSATAWMNGLPIVGSDRLIDGVGAMQWKLLGLFPVMTASGSDITRSAFGRLQAESTWLPSVFCGDEVSWKTMDSSHLHSSFVVQNEIAELDLTIDRVSSKLSTCRAGAIQKVLSLIMWISVEFWRKRTHFVATPFRLACELDGTSALSGLIQRASSFEPRSMMPSIDSSQFHVKGEGRK